MGKSGGAYKFLEPDAVARLGRIDLVAKYVVEGFIAGLHRSPYRGFSVEFAEHREYMPGDDIKDIDWLVYARTDRYYVKQYEEETNLRAHILLDISGSMGYRSEENSLTKFDYACYLSACLSYLLVRQQDPVGLVCFDERIRTYVPPRCSLPHLNLVLRHLEKLKPGKPTKISETFHDLAEYIKRRGLLIIISDLFDEPKDVLRALHHFRHKKHEVMVFHIFDRWELEFPFKKLTDFIDMETEEEIQVDPKYIREEYLNLVNEFIDEYRRDCSASRIEYVQTDTSVPYDLMLMAFLVRRAKIRG